MRPWILTLVLLLAAAASPLSADYKDSYKEGFTAVERKQWAKAEQALRRAIAENPQAGGRPVAVYGRRFEPYLPHYFLGLALYQQGDLRGAFAAWQVAERQGEVRDSSFKKDFDRLWTEVSASQIQVADQPPPKPDDTPEETVVETPVTTPVDTSSGPSPAEVARLAAAAQTAIRGAEQAAGRLENEVGAGDLARAFERQPALGERRRRAQSQLANARELQTQGESGQDIDKLEQARNLADSSQSELAALLPAVRTELEAIADAREEEDRQAERERRAQAVVLRTRIADLSQTAGNVLEGAAAVTPEPPQLSSARAQLERLVRQASESETLEIEELDRLERTLGLTIAAVEAAVEQAVLARQQGEEVPTAVVDDRPPDELVQAVRAYFSASYDRVLQLLGETNFDDLRAKSQAHLFRAAASFALYRGGRSQDDELLTAARSELQALRGLQPSFSPNPTRFSPAFMAFFEGS